MSHKSTGRQKFKIPVMGTGYTINPINAVIFGIGYTIPLLDDIVIEKARKILYKKYRPGLVYKKIMGRIERIRAYFNLINEIVNELIAEMKGQSFDDTGNNLNKYFVMLPDNSPLRQQYLMMKGCVDSGEKAILIEELKEEVEAGSIDVNIMTKLDNSLDVNGKEREYDDAISAFIGYATSDLCGNTGVEFSTGLYKKLYNLMGDEKYFDYFRIQPDGSIKKKIIIKVSTYNSAYIQSRYFAKLGLWVSEFRIESGLNCGGHAFATKGYLMGPILEEFKVKIKEFRNKLFIRLNEFLVKKEKPEIALEPRISLVFQGGIGTAGEQKMLEGYVDETSWGTPFLLVQEVTSVDKNTLKILGLAKEENLKISRVSPMRIAFNNINTSSLSVLMTRVADELIDALKNENDIEARVTIVKKWRYPKIACPKRYLVTFGEGGLCLASYEYKLKKLIELVQADASLKEIRLVVIVQCICHCLGNSFLIKEGNKKAKEGNEVSICPGPNIAYFNKEITLVEMVDHIYGRINLLEDVQRPHIFINELELYINYMETNKWRIDYPIEIFINNLKEGIDYYREWCKEWLFDQGKENFLRDLNALHGKLLKLNLVEILKKRQKSLQ